MKQILSLLLFFGITFGAFCSSVDTVTIFSASMQKQIKCVVIKPNKYKKKKDFSVVYLLHGYGGNYSDWIKKASNIKKYVDDYNILIVCPDGAIGSWYFDSPIDTTYRYQTHVATEVVNYIDSHYKTIPSPQNRAITGLSMGGHGAFFVGLQHASTFGAIGSMSGGVDLNESKGKFDVAKRIGDTVVYANNWFNFSVLNVIEKYKTTNQKIIFDCGVGDFFLNGNRLLHKKMVDLKVAHTYIEREGKHNWPYWQNAIQYQLLFFYNFFNSTATVSNK